MFDSGTVQSKRTRTLRPDARPIEDGRWIWPLPRLAGEKPTIIAHNDGYAIDVGYEHVDFGELFVPVCAAQFGTITFSERTSNGCAVTIDHDGRWSTHYAHLREMFVVRTLPDRRNRVRVRAGEVIGYAARSPIHVRFELWQRTNERGLSPVIAAPRMRDWLVLPQFEPQPTNSTKATA